jgi:hypothetical protein
MPDSQDGAASRQVSLVEILRLRQGGVLAHERRVELAGLPEVGGDQAVGGEGERADVTCLVGPVEPGQGKRKVQPGREQPPRPPRNT